MSDLDKMMEKLNKNSPAEKEIEEPKKDLIDKDDDDGKDLEEEIDTVNDTVNDTEHQPGIPEENKDQQDTADNEVGILQNIGVFRRELLIIKKDFLEVEKVKVQALITIAKSLEKLNGNK